MRGPRSLQDFSRLTGVGADEIERYRSAGLLDPEEDRLFDDDDVLRLRYLKLFSERGMTIDEIAAGVRERTLDVPFFGDLLFPAGGRPHTERDAAEQMGMRPEKVRELRSALGITGSMYGTEDLEALRGVKLMLDAGLPWEALVEGTRVFADSLRRVAQTEIRLLHDHIHEPMAAGGVSETAIGEQTEAIVVAIQPVIEQLIRYTHGTFLIRAVADDVLVHLEAGEGRPTREATIAFVDLTGFTTLAELQGDEVASDIIFRFDGMVRDLLVEHDGTLVKQIGDACMLTFADPADAVRFASALDEAVGRQEGFPSIRAGVHHGPVSYRVGDYVGNTVNVASRIAAAAMPNEIVLTEPVGDACRAAGIAVEDAGVRLVRGTKDPLTLYRVGRVRAPTASDPVCGKPVDGERAAARLTQDGTQFSFCSQDCLRAFVEDPARYARV